MKRFIIIILLFIAIPLIMLAFLYIWTDPFKCIQPFDINDVDVTNREYQSTELFLRNEPVCHYNSFLFGSSRGGGINTYQWKQYLAPDAQPFLFQAWSESLTGIELKINYLHEQNIPIVNALLFFDIPMTFREDQLPHEAISLKHYIFTNQSKFMYNVIQYTNFIQKPSLCAKSVRKRMGNVRIAFNSDSITNDWERTNKYNYAELPPQDSLKQCSDISRRTFFAQIEHSNKEIVVSEPLITARFKSQLLHIKSILDANNTDYHIIITPAPCYTHPEINPNDLALLQEIFGEERVHNYAGPNEMTEDYNNFADPNHFGARVGHLIIEDIYKH